MASRRPRTVVALVVVLVIVLFATGWSAARQFQSPAQREAAARPPAALPVVAAVTEGGLVDQVSGSGRVVYRSQTALSPTAYSANAVITGRVATDGARLRAAEVLTEINGRPVLVLSGEFAFYRDLAPDAEGPDVRQLQSGLRAAGYSIAASENGRFGNQTAAALANLYKKRGYSPPTGLPLTEVAVAAYLPATLVKAPRVGAHPAAGEPLATVARGRLSVSATLDSGAFVRLERGFKATVTIGGKPPVQATVTQLTPATDADGESTVMLQPASDLPPSSEGRAAVAVITIDVVAPRSLLVSTRAVAAGAGGGHSVAVQRKVDGGRPGEVRATEVKVLGTLNGVTAVEPVHAGELRVNDLVVVG